MGKEIRLEVLSEAEITNLARDKAPEMLAILCRIAADDSAPGHARVGAANSVLAYAYGRPGVRAREDSGKAKRSGAPARLVHPGDDDFQLPIEGEFVEVGSDE